MANLENPTDPTFPTWPILHFLHGRVCRIYITYNGGTTMFTVGDILSTQDEVNALLGHLHYVGLYETLCFKFSNDKEWWFIQDNTLIYSEWNDIGECDFMIDYWDI